MPVPLNAVVELARCWLTKRLGYHVDDTIPVRQSKEAVKVTTPMDIDLICSHPRESEVRFSLGTINYVLPRNLLVECKGWFDYPQATSGILKDLSDDIQLMGDNNFIPKRFGKDKLHFTFLKEEHYEKGKEVFGVATFARVLICPHLRESQRPRNRPLIDKGTLLEKARGRGIFIVELNHMIEDLIDFCGEPEAKDFLRRNFVLEFLSLLKAVKLLK